MANLTILCAGGSRSGSTWQYNAVRAVLQEHGRSAYAAWIDRYDQARPEPVHVVKLHRFDLASRFPDAIAVGSYRDLRDVVCSLDRMGWLAGRRASALRDLIDRFSSFNRRLTARRFVDSYIRDQALWSARAVYMMRYEEMITAPAEEVRRLAAAIGFDVSRSSAGDIAQRLKDLRPPADDPSAASPGADPETLLHPGHIGHEGQRGDERLRRYVTQRYAQWLKEHSYA